MTPRLYASPLRFKDALEQRLRNAATDGVAFARARQMLVFDRFLARVATGFGDAAVLKGGLVLELRLARARTTRDIDLRMMGTPQDLLPRLQATARLDLGDFMAFEVVPHPGGAEIDNDALRYEGFRFRVTCTLAGKPYGEPFGVDVAFGEPILGEPDVVAGPNLLAFAGIAPPTVRLYPVETHIAEKLHAYTMPRRRPNTRVKDLPDIALLASAQVLDASRVRSGLEQTFTFRATHPLPPCFPPPAVEWERPYAAMAREDGLRWPDLAAVAAAATAFLDPVLAGTSSGRWDPAVWRWSAT
jgi:hypothetical protein